MKLTTSLIICLIMCFCLSCSNDDLKHVSTESMGVLGVYRASQNSMNYPIGTQFIEETSSKLRIVLPTGFIFVFVNDSMSQGSITSGDEKCYSCESECTIGCDVAYAMGTLSCTACDPNDNVSTECTGSYVDCDEGIKLNDIYLFSLSNGVDFIGSKQEFEKLNYVDISDSMIYSLGLETHFFEFNSLIYGMPNPSLNTIDSLDCVILPVNAFGNLIGYKIPRSFIEENNIYEGLSVDVESHVKCKCTQGESGCTLGVIFGGVICRKGVCKRCNMRVSKTFSTFIDTK